MDQVPDILVVHDGQEEGQRAASIDFGLENQEAGGTDWAVDRKVGGDDGAVGQRGKDTGQAEVRRGAGSLDWMEESLGTRAD